MTTALIDGDIVVYRAASPVQKTVDWGDGLGAIAQTNHEAAAKLAVKITTDWARKARCDAIVVALSDPSHNFRRQLADSYKANRKGIAKPMAFDTVRQALAENFRTVLIGGLEADDTMGIMHTGPKHAGSSVIVSIDKDMLGVPGTHFNPIKDPRPHRVLPATAVLHWMTQTLTGDSVDNIKGIPKVGPVGAAAILAKAQPTLGALWVAVVDAYRRAGLTEADAILNARLTRILRRSDFHPDTLEIDLWHPTKPRRVKLPKAASSPTLASATPPPPSASEPVSD